MNVRSAAALTLALYLTGCAGSGSLQPADSKPAASIAAPQIKIKGEELLYAGWQGRAPLVTVYGGSPLGLVGGLNQETTGLVTDPTGKVYVVSQNVVYIFRRGLKKLLVKISKNLKEPRKVAVDGDGNVYVVDNRGVAIYRNAKENHMKRIRTEFVQAIALDASNNLYVATNRGAIDVYPEDSAQLSRTIAEGIDAPKAIAFNAGGTMYVANVFATGKCGSSNNAGNVTVYAPGGSSPIATITTQQGLCNPIALAFDASENLYVANNATGDSSLSSVTVYAPGTLSLVRTIANGMNNPAAIAVDGAGNLYVANEAADVGTGSVTVYAAQSNQLLQTLSNGSNSARDLVLGK